MPIAINDLPLLNDIINEIVIANQNPSTDEKDEKDKQDLLESIHHLIHQYMDINIINIRYEKFESKLKDYISFILNDIYLISDLDIDNLIEITIKLYMQFINTPKFIKHSSNINPIDKIFVTKQLKYLRKIDEHEQQTKEWYIFRWNHITASSAWKAFDSQATKNQLIYSKCQPINIHKKSSVNITSPCHHGHKYEPLSTKLYEMKNNTVIEEFGCLEHETIKYIAASPDGINVDPNSKLYGRLLEIKNPVSREIKGIPKKEYWVQMQMQMAVCKLYLCDFLETSFKEYESEEDFLKDGTFNLSDNNKIKGIIILLNGINGPVYKYPKFNLNKKEFDEWQDKIINENNNLSWIQNIYWKLDVYSCITVPFNSKWFAQAKPYFKNIWDSITNDRINGFAHRKAKSRKKKKINENIPVIKINTETAESNPAV